MQIDAQTFKTACPVCTGHIAADLVWIGRRTRCPHCDAPIIFHGTLAVLDGAKLSPGQVASGPSETATGRNQQKSVVAGWGCLVQVIGLGCFGLAVIFYGFNPISQMLTLLFGFVGLILLLVGSRMAIKRVCSVCGNRLDSRMVRMCPTCHARLD